MVDSTGAFAVISAVVVLFVSAAVWRHVSGLRLTVRRLQQEIAALQRDRAARPSPRMSFEFNSTTREALVHVTNDGGDGEMHAAMSIEGALATSLNGGVSAAWSESGRSTEVVRRGETKTLRLARLDLSVFPYAQWELYAVSGDTMVSMRAMRSSTIGGDPETHAPAMFLQLALATVPEATAPPTHCTIALQPFDAVRLRPF